MGKTKTKCISGRDDEEDIWIQPYHLYSSPYVSEMIKSKEKKLCWLGMTQVRSEIGTTFTLENLPL
jgi:hypothetical protein